MGISATQFDGLIDHLRSFFAPLPEIVPIALPSSGERIVVMIRVDADAYLHPVVVSGRVVYRVPGATVSADRRKILDLSARDSLNANVGLPDAPRDPSQMDLWGNAEPGFPVQATNFHLDLRVVGGVQLPPSLSTRPWLTSAGLAEALAAVADSYRPRSLVGQARLEEAGPYEWRVRDRRSTWASLVAKSLDQTQGDVAVDAALHLSLAGRHLSGVVGLRAVNLGPIAVPLGLGQLFSALHMQLQMLSEVFERVAAALGGSRMSVAGPWQAWLRCGRNFTVLDLIELDGFVRDSDSRPVELVFVPMRAGGPRTEGLVELVKSWLEIALLDLGLRDFEADLDRISTLY